MFARGEESCLQGALVAGSRPRRLFPGGGGGFAAEPRRESCGRTGAAAAAASRRAGRGEPGGETAKKQRPWSGQRRTSQVEFLSHLRVRKKQQGAQPAINAGCEPAECRGAERGQWTRQSARLQTLPSLEVSAWRAGLGSSRGGLGRCAEAHSCSLSTSADNPQDRPQPASGRGEPAATAGYLHCTILMRPGLALATGLTAPP